jgi:hypothetical protein
MTGYFNCFRVDGSISFIWIYTSFSGVPTYTENENLSLASAFTSADIAALSGLDS